VTPWEMLLHDFTGRLGAGISNEKKRHYEHKGTT